MAEEGLGVCCCSALMFGQSYLLVLGYSRGRLRFCDGPVSGQDNPLRQERVR